MWITVLPCLHPVGKIVPFGGIFGGFNDYLPLSGHMAFSHLLSWYISERTGPLIFLFDLLLGYSMIAMRRHYTIELVSSVLAIQAIVRLIP